MNKKLVLRELLKAFPEVDYFDTTDLIQCMQEIYAEYVGFTQKEVEALCKAQDLL